MSRKTRICPDCQSREVEFHCRLCSECRSINTQLSKDIYAAGDGQKQSQAKYLKSEKGKKSNSKSNKKWRENNKDENSKRLLDWKSEKVEHIKNYNRNYYLNKPATQK